MTDRTAMATGVDRTLGEGGAPHRHQQHLAPLDGLRGWAATIVVFAHISQDWHVIVVPPQLGTYGVMLFFVLSGFLMGHLYLPKSCDAAAVRTYFAARISRIVPLYYATLLVGFAIGQWVDPGFPYAMTTMHLLRHLLFVGSTSVFWSIGPEFQFYFAFPLLWWWFGLNSDRRFRIVAWGAPAILLIILLRADWPGVFVLSKLHVFLAGIAVARFRRKIGGLGVAGHWRIAQIAAACFLVALLLPQQVFGAILYPPIHGDIKLGAYYADFGKLLVIAYCVLVFSIETRFSHALFANPVLRLLGKYSFSIYLLHTPLLYALKAGGLIAAVGPVIAVPIALALTLVLSALSFRLFEDPSRIGSRIVLLRMFNARLRPAIA